MTTSNILSQLGSPGVSTGFRNRIINGAMVIDQRNTGASVSLATGPTYLVDRFRWDSSASGKATSQQNAGSVTPPVGFTNYLGLTSSSAYSVGSGDFFRVMQLIEGYNIADLAWGTADAKTVTLSFLVRSSLTGTFGGCVQNSATNRSYPFSYSIPVANTWTSISVTIPGDTTGSWATNNTSGIQIQWGLGVGSTYSGTAGAWAAANYVSATGATSVVGTNGATFYITGVQFEVGTTATQFEYRDFPSELNRCQRYFEKSFDYAVAPAHGTGGLPVIPIGSSLGCGGNAYWVIPFKTCKRTASYTVRWYDPIAGHSNSENWVRYITDCGAGAAAGPNSNMQFNSNFSNHMAGYSQVGTGVPPIFYWTADAEL